MDATQPWGWGGIGHVNVSCKLACVVDATQPWGWGGIGHVNVPC